MTDQIETYVREQFAADAHRAPLAHDLAGSVRGRVRRQRRRRLAVLAATAAAIALVAGAGLLATAVSDKAGPTDPARPSESPSAVKETGAAARALTYAVGQTIHYGDQSIDTGREVHFLAVTDDGVVFASPDNRVWFTDGSDIIPIGKSGPGFPRGWAIESANTGSIVAWWEDDKPSNWQGQLVVYDTRQRRVVGRIGDSDGPVMGYQSFAVYDDYVYWTTEPDSGSRLMRYEVATGTQTEVPAASYEADQRSRPRRLIAELSENGDDPLERGNYFRRVGSHLIGADTADVGHDVPLQSRARKDVFLDTRTGKRMVLRIPSGYDATDAFALVQWLDDDRVALVADYRGWNEFPSHEGDIFTCRLSTSRCVIAVPDFESPDRDPAGEPTGFVVPGNPFS